MGKKCVATFVLMILWSAASAAGWTGCYVGAQVGGLWSQSENWTVRTPGAPHANESLGSHNANGWLGGVQAGCDYEFANRVVIGIMGEYAGTDAEGSHDSARETGVTYHSKVKSLATLAVRVAHSWDRLLGYVKGGAAWERDEYWANQTILGTAYKSTETRPGWTIGVGAEYLFTPTLSGLVEYGYYDYGARTVSLAPQVSGLPTAFVEITQRTSVVRIGINYRFGR